MHTGNSHLKYDYTVRGLREVVKMTADISQAKAGQGRAGQASTDGRRICGRVVQDNSKNLRRQPRETSETGVKAIELLLLRLEPSWFSLLSDFWVVTIV